MADNYSKSDSSVQLLLAQLRSPSGDEVFARFLDLFSSAIFQVARQYSNDHHHLDDCYQFVTEKLSANNFHRLLSYKPEGSASFRSWFNVIVANLCIDWRRHQYGRPRFFKSIKKLSRFDQSVFKYRFQQRLGLDACFETLRGHFPECNRLQLAGAVARINLSLTPAQMKALYAQQSKTVSLNAHQDANNANELPHPGRCPETTTIFKQDKERLQQALAGLSPHHRLLIKLRYQQDLSLKEVARLTRMGDPFRARRHIQAALEQLGKFFEN
jgi:RNA polymerase sigma factor (sigma-70 family)